ncbi:hypothetical protein EB796_014185 [Bugula neritina]|uniref:Secreted protein n=1 Tax=Bugula neritina TaxID=10212 RepID=A0A7J7JMF5_BUGNE|nr:hypothetical protein EB796_014185 [Bugula neritina]
MTGVLRIACDLLVTAVLDLCWCMMSCCMVGCACPSRRQPLYSMVNMYNSYHSPSKTDRSEDYKVKL